MEENRNNGMNGMNPNMSGMNPPMGARGIPVGMNQNMNGMGGMNPAAGGMNRPPVLPNDKQPAAPVPPVGAGVSTALVPVGKATKEPEKKKKKKRPSVLYNIFAILMFLLMVGGLFLGLLGKYWVYLSPSSLYLPENVENTTLTGTLVGILIDGIMNIQGYLSFGEGVTGIMGALQHLLPAVSLLVLAVCIVYGLIAMIIALFSRTNSRRALQIVSTCMLVGYGCCGLSTLFFGSFAQVDFVSLALAALGFLNCFITAIIANKQIGAMNAFISLFSIAATALFALPMSDMRRYAFETDAMMPVIFGFVSLGVLYLNFFFTAARICAKKGKIFDLVMHTLQFALIVTVFVMTLLATNPMTDMFRMIMPLVCSVGSPALALVTFALSLVIVFMPKILKKAEDKKANKSGAKANAKTKEKDKKKKEKDQPDEQRPMNPALPYGAPAPMGPVPAQPVMNRPAPAQPQPQPQQAQRPMQQPQQPMRPMPNQANRPPMRPNPPRKDDDFSGTAKSFKVPFSTGGGDKKTDPATQAALEKLAQEMRNMKEAQSHAVSATPQEDSKTREAIESLAEQLRAMKESQKQTSNQEDTATKSAIEQLTEELRAMKEAQAKAEAERRAAEEAKRTEAEREAERKAAEEARIAEAERKAAEAKAEAERIAKEAERKAAEARLEAEKRTEEERRRLEEERRRLEEERRAAEAARLEAERKAAEAKAEAERRAAEAKAEADRRAAEEARAEAERRAAEAKAEAERKAEEERRKIEEEKRKLEEERKAVEAAKAEAEKKRQDELEQLKRELRELKTAQNQPVEPDTGDDNMAKIMEELRALKDAQGTTSTTYNYLQDDSHGKELSEFEKRMEELIRSSQKKEPTPKREPTAFEKRMAELAARKAAMANGAGASSGAAASPRASMPPQPAASNEPSRYGSPSLDPFFSTLSNAEINEFGDIFIANKLGVLEYMPAYAIGGDNKDFFNKVVIYLGKFRGNISRALLDKLLKYIRSAR